MKIQIASDIHLEFGHTVRIENAGADVLVLAGDICCARSFKSKEKNIENYDLYRFFEEVSKNFKDVIYIMGNHEHYKFSYRETEICLRDFLSEYKNIHFLQNQSFVIDGVRFIGSTLWTDMNKNCPLTKNALEQYMNDFRIIKFKDMNDNYFKFTPDIAYGEHRNAINFIGHELADHPDQKCVVVTHHAPSFQSVHPKYADQTLMNGGYASDLEHVFTDNVKLWVHGHMHDSFDYVVGSSRVVCNPYGYPRERESVNTKLVLEI